MSAPDQLVDPQLAAFAAADPTVLQPPEVAAAPVGHDHTRAEIAAAVLVVCALIVRHLLKQRPASIEEAQHQARSVWQRVAPLWLRLTVPAIKQAYQLGRIAELSEPELQALAEAYAGAVGDYLGQTSADAVLDGFNAQLAGRWSADLAWHRAATAYGLDRQQMRAYIRGAVTGADVGVSDPVPPAARALADKALLIRATRLGEEEAFSAVENGRAIAWMWLAGSGRLPADARRRWITTETDCPICQPMDGVDAPIAEPFTLPDGRSLWAPRAHPGCRCHVELITPEPIEKNTVTDPYDRDTHGRFAPVESRGRLRTLQRDPAIDALLSQIETAPRSLLDTGRKSLLAPSLLSQESLLGQGSLLEQKSLLGQESLLEQASATQVETSLGSVLTRSAAKAAALGHKVLITVQLPQWQPPPVDAPPKTAFYVPLAAWLHGAGFDMGDRAYGGANPNSEDFIADLGWFAEAAMSPGDYGTGYSFDDLGEAEGDIMAVHSNSPAHLIAGEDGVSPELDEDAYENWHELMENMLASRQEALERSDEIIDDLEGVDIRRILWLAGRGLGAKDNTEGLRAELRSAAHGADRMDLSVKAAYADYITFQKPYKTDAGFELAGQMEARGIDSVYEQLGRVQQLLVFDQGMHPDTQVSGKLAAMRGEYVTNHVWYRSALGEMGLNAPVGVIGWSEAHMIPVDESGNPIKPE